ncbi:MAG: pyridoxal-phosphate dependent enzyme [Planctomycetes bacterium]|nr:pyridoxal-phosphate dependent enzyme [Planctomycetota bacterium]
MLSLELIAQAQHRLRGLVKRTPLVMSDTLSQRLGTKVSLKLECLQKTGSFKPRGAFNKMLTLTESERSRGVVAVSGGNHAQGVAFAARRLGISAVIVMPETTPQNYLDATRGYGAEIVLMPNISAAFVECERLRAAGRVLVHPFDDPLVAAGQGTLGLEILEDAPDVTKVYVSIGGGALISGMAMALRSINPDVQVIGVQTHGADAMAQSVAANRLVQLSAITSIARTLGAPQVSDFTLNHVQRLVQEIVVVEDSAAFASLVFLLERTKYLVEPAAACCLAAVEQQREQLLPHDHVVILMCGGNLSVQDLSAFHQRFTK